MVEEIRGCHVLYWCSPLHSRGREEETGGTDGIASVHRVLSIYPGSRYLGVYVFLFFHHSFSLRCLKKWWSKPDRLASFKTLGHCKEKMLTASALMPSREARADYYLRKCGQNSKRWWQIPTVLNTKLANIQRMIQERATHKANSCLLAIVIAKMIGAHSGSWS